MKINNKLLVSMAVAAALSAILNSIFIIANWYAVTPNGSDSGLWYSSILGLIFIGLCVLTPLPLIGLFSKRLRNHSIRALGFIAIYSLIAVICIDIGDRVRMHGFKMLAKRSNILITAIKLYEADYGKPPQSLNQLIPKYIKEIPKTGIGAYPTYDYKVGEQAKEFSGNDWALAVFTPSGGINFDQFIYFPKQNYPASGYGGWLERIEDWAYVHE
jgi:hypothetical protein